MVVVDFFVARGRRSLSLWGGHAFKFAALFLIAACSSKNPVVLGDAATDSTITTVDIGSGVEIGSEVAVSIDTGRSGSDSPASESTYTGPPLSLTATPPTLTVTLADGVATTNTSAITVATASGTPISGATFSLNRSDMGTIDSSGTFSANGLVAGTVTIYAVSGGSIGSVQVTVTTAITQSGPAETDPLGVRNPSGYWGVGGEGPGVTPDATTIALLQSSTPSSDSTMKWLYPYQHTVWPRGLLPPLLQWDSTLSADAVHLEIAETGYQWDGYYAYDPSVTVAGSDSRHRINLEPTVWTDAVNSNSDGAMTFTMWYTSGGVLYGPFIENWTIAGGNLKGTIYYASYDTALVNQSYTGGVLKIRPATPNPPALAVPSLNNKCHVCHEVAANGSTLFTNTGDDQDNYGYAYDLTNGSAQLDGYTANNVQNMFTYGGIYPDGTMGLANSNDNWHSYASSSNLFGRDSSAAVPTTGFTNFVTKAVTPIFSPDGLHVAFAWWSGTASNGVAPNNGQTLVAMDFNCGAPAGSVTCSGATPYAFSNLRQIYHSNVTTDEVGQPTFSPAGDVVYFQHTTEVPPTQTCTICGGTSPACTLDGSTGLTTGTTSSCTNNKFTANGPWSGLATFGQAYIQMADSRTSNPLPTQILYALNGQNSDGTSYLPTHSYGGINTWDDTHLNYEPNASPISSGSFVWVIFTSRRRYGNIAQGNPFDGRTVGSGPSDPPVTKKLWIAAIDLSPTAGKDPSHPAFYLPAQELQAGNMRGFMVADVCQGDGTSCQTGDECCGGYCRADATGTNYSCLSSPPNGCSNVYEHCVTNADCCSSTSTCVANLCSSTVIYPPPT